MRVHLCVLDLRVNSQSLPQFPILHHSQIKGKAQPRQDRGNKRDGWRDRGDRRPFRRVSSEGLVGLKYLLTSLASISNSPETEEGGEEGEEKVSQGE